MIRRYTAAAVLISMLAGAAVYAQGTPGVTRVNLQRHDISVPGREAVQLRVDIAEGAFAPRHSHPGEEIIYVLQGSLQYQIDGSPPVTLNAGGVLFVPAGAVHSARNVGTGTGSELSTYIVAKDQPLVAPAR